MFSEKARQIADAILYEGYLLYPYRASALKNRQRFNFGVIHPQAEFQAQILVAAPETASILVRLRFLHLQTRQVVDENGNLVERLEAGGEIFQTWQEAIEREVDAQIFLSDKNDGNSETKFAFTAEWSETRLNQSRAKIVRTSESIEGAIKIETEKRGENLFRVTLKIINQSENVELAALSRSFVSTHALLRAADGDFVSLLEFSAEFSGEVAGLKQNGLFPVLVERDVMLASPIILYDFPSVAPESDGDFFDATEIDELLTLRILTMTDEEKNEAARLDPRAQKILAQAENSRHSTLHGVWRATEQAEKPAQKELKIKQKVVLRPKPHGDIFDLVLDGKIATVIGLEVDFEGKPYVVVVLDDDEGKDLGWDKFVGHRFFFDPEEVEVIDE